MSRSPELLAAATAVHDAADRFVQAVAHVGSGARSWEQALDDPCVVAASDGLDEAQDRLHRYGMRDLGLPHFQDDVYAFDQQDESTVLAVVELHHQFVVGVPEGAAPDFAAAEELVSAGGHRIVDALLRAGYEGPSWSESPEAGSILDGDDDD